jgi:GT2 family glycosyltransferase
VNAKLIKEAVAALRAGAAGGGAPVRFDRSPWWIGVLMWAVIPVFRLAKWAAGCFVYCDRAVFYQTGGFDERYFAAEEIFFSQALKRHGRFVTLRSFVTSSSRKLYTHGFWHFAWLCLKVGVRGPSSLKSRANAEFWYPEKR